MPDAKKNVAYTFDLCLVETANRPNFKANPTLATGDVKVSIDEGALANITTLPTVAPASSRVVKVALSQSEMNGDRIIIQFVDAAGSEWDECVVTITTTAQTVDDVATQTSVNTIDDFLDTEIAAIKAVTDALPNAGALTTIQADLDDIQSRLPAALTAGGNIKADALAISGDTVAADNLELFFDGTGYNAANSTVGTVTLVTTLTTYTGNTPQTGDAYAIVNSGVHGNAAIKGYVDDIGVAGVGLTAIPWNASWDAEVQSECADALTAYGVSTVTTGQVNTEVDTALADYDGPTHAELTSALAALPLLDAAGVRSAVGLASANLDTQLAALAAYVDTEVAAILAAVDTEVTAIKAKTDNLPASPAATGDAMTLTTQERLDSADVLLKRDVDQVEATAAIHSITSAVLKLVSRFKASTGQTFRTDGSTVHMTQAVTQGTITPITELGVGA